MAVSKIAITLDEQMLKKLDQMVKEGIYPNRSKAVQSAVEGKIAQIEKRRLAEECAKLNPQDEKSMADEGLSLENGEWPEY